MSPVRKPQALDHSVLNEMLAIRMQQLEIENGGAYREPDHPHDREDRVQSEYERVRTSWF